MASASNYQHFMDLNSPVPIYHQIFTSIRNRIINNEWEINESIPSEFDLSEQYGVSRVTLRQALSKLEQDGIIKKIRGKGNFIQSIPKPIIHDFNLPSTLWGAIERGTTFDAEVLELTLVEPVAAVNSTLRLESSEPLVFIKRLFLQDDRPIALNRSWIASRFIPDLPELGLIDNHLSTTLASRYGLIPARIDNEIEAVRPTTEDVQALKVVYDTPMLCVSSVSFLDNGHPLECSSTLWVGGRVKFHFNMDRNKS